jgi:trigger factor
MSFQDGVASKFAEQVAGVKAGESRTIDVSMTDAVANDRLKGQTVQATLEIKDVKRLRLPDIDDVFLENHSCKTVGQFRERLRLILEQRLRYAQRQSAREQILGLIAASATWELPQELLQRQARKTLARRVMEMREAGIGEEEIKARQRLLERDVLQSTALAMKEHFVLQKIAEKEKLDLDQGEIDQEIERIAEEYQETPRRIRAQMERDDLMEYPGTSLAGTAAKFTTGSSKGSQSATSSAPSSVTCRHTSSCIAGGYSNGSGHGPTGVSWWFVSRWLRILMCTVVSPRARIVGAGVVPL